MPTEVKRYGLGTVLVVVGVAVFAGLLTFRGCSAAEDTPGEFPVFRTASEARRGLDEAAQLSLDPLRDFYAGETLTDKQKADLEGASRLLTGVIAFDPDSFSSYVAAGRIEFALADYDEAELALREAMQVAPEEPQGELAQVVAEGHYLLSRTLFEKRLYAAAIDEAEVALALAPENADNLAARAAALIQVGKPDDAAKDLAHALLHEPDHHRALQLKRLLSLGGR